MKKAIQAALTEGFTNPVRDVLWGHIYLKPSFTALLGSPHFMRLCRIQQLGPVFLVYPGATHTRASHSIGVYHLGRRLLQNLAERGAGEWLTPDGVNSFLCACLLHDLGHFPFTHSLKELPLASHEELTGAIILEEPMKSLVKKTGADPNLTAAIVDKDMAVPEGAMAELQFFRKLLSGCLDPDKLDYLNRDGRYCGVTYGAQDVDFILSGLYPHIERGADIDSKLIPNVEAILFSKYLMYRAVYWHRQVRSATAMIKKALINGLESGHIKGEQLYGLDDQNLFSLLQEKTSSSIGKAVREGNIYETILEIPFDEEVYGVLRNINRRCDCEKQITAELRGAGVKLGVEDLIIDIPEPVSFETGLFVLDEKCFFGESSSAFKAETLNSFIKTLYTIRIFANPDFTDKINSLPDRHAILNIREK
ncbi:MAG: HD domain-containing protein [Treponema sp.]|nr:HD domain-containing protein [Treponema sp.]